MIWVNVIWIKIEMQNYYLKARKYQKLCKAEKFNSESDFLTVMIFKPDMPGNGADSIRNSLSYPYLLFKINLY